MSQPMKNKDDIFMQLATDLGKLLAEKTLAYGDAFSKTTQILTLLYPQGIKVQQYKDVHVLVRMLDKMSRIAQDNDPMGESPYKDLAGYAILAQANLIAQNSK